MKAIGYPLIPLLFSAGVALSEEPPITLEEFEQFKKDIAAAEGTLTKKEVSKQTKVQFFVARAMHDDMDLEYVDWEKIAHVNFNEMKKKKHSKDDFNESICPIVEGQDAADVDIEEVLKELHLLDINEKGRWDGIYVSLLNSMTSKGRKKLQEATEQNLEGQAVEADMNAIAKISPKIFIVNLQQRCSGPQVIGPVPKAG